MLGGMDPREQATEVQWSGDLALDAVALWLELGCLSLTNPVLKFALETFMAPCGVTAQWLEGEITTFRFSTTVVKMHSASFDPRLVAAELKDDYRRTFLPLREHPTFYKATVSSLAYATFIFDPAAVKGDLHAPQIAKDLQYAVDRAPGLIKEAFGYMAKFLNQVGNVLASETPEDAALQRLFIDRSYAAFCEGVLSIGARRP
jgi:hypothetical protein